MSPKLRGALYTLGSAACLSVTFVASKQALQELPLLGFATIWFIMASLWGLGYYIIQPDKVSLVSLKLHWQTLFLLGLCSSIANYFFFSAVNLGDPTVVAFFSRSETIFSLLLGVILLGEQMTGLQWLGAVVAIVGAGLMTYQAGSLIWAVLGLSLLGNFFNALTSYIAKRNITDILPLILGISRTVVLAFCLGMLAFLADDLVWPTSRAFFWIAGGSFFAPFLSYFLFYKGMVSLEISQAAIIRATQPLFVALYSFVLFGSLVSGQQFAGGMVILCGVVMILWSYRRARSIEQEWLVADEYKMQKVEERIR